ncbi:linoleate 13S-lipoxygenase 2-1, related protein [Sesbania bispinosa]|nr:linoleate 13S-lipoxygenase 2-1, related protein [Sesbania bispinosa]
MAEMKIFMVMDACQLNNKIPLIGFQERYPLNLSHSTIHQKQRLLVFSSSKTKLRVGQKEKQNEPILTVEAQQSMDSMKLTALVAVRNNNNKDFANEMVNNLLSLFMPQGHNRGCVVLQLVSTQLDASKSPSLI